MLKSFFFVAFHLDLHPFLHPPTRTLMSRSTSPWQFPGEFLDQIWPKVVSPIINPPNVEIWVVYTIHFSLKKHIKRWCFLGLKPHMMCCEPGYGCTLATYCPMIPHLESTTTLRGYHCGEIVLTKHVQETLRCLWHISRDLMLFNRRSLKDMAHAM